MLRKRCTSVDFTFSMLNKTRISSRTPLSVGHQAAVSAAPVGIRLPAAAQSRGLGLAHKCSIPASDRFRQPLGGDPSRNIPEEASDVVYALAGLGIGAALRM